MKQTRYLTEQETLDIKKNYMYSGIYKKNYFTYLLLKKKELTQKLFKEIIESRHKTIHDYSHEYSVILNNLISSINILRFDLTNIVLTNVNKENRCINKSSTQTILINLLNLYLKNKNLKMIDEKLYLLIKKFEISKVFYSKYDHKIKRKLTNEEDINSYMYFSMILMILYLRKNYDLRLINCFFKVSDKILSNHIQKFSKREILLIIYFNYYLINDLKNKYEHNK
jgi:hypothetical protein